MDTRDRLNPADYILRSYVLHKRESKPLLSTILQGRSDMIGFIVDDKETIVGITACLNIIGRILCIILIDIPLELHRKLLVVNRTTYILLARIRYN